MRTLVSTSLMLAVAVTWAFAARKAAAENKQLQEEVRKVETAMPTKVPPQSDPRGYASLDLSKGGVQSDLADLKPRAKIVVAGRTLDVARLPAGLKYFADFGVIAPAWLDIRPLHRFPLPPLDALRRPPGGNYQPPGDVPSAYVDCPRPFIAPNGNMLVTLVAGEYHYGGRSLAMKLNDIFLYRSRDRGQTWDPPVKIPNVYNQHAWVPLVPRHSFGGKRIYVFYTYPTPGDFNGSEDAGIGMRWSGDDGRTWSPPERIRPVNDPRFQGMWCINATETDAGTWLIAPHTGDATALYVLRSDDRGKTWTCLPGKRPGGWRSKQAKWLVEGRPIALGGTKVALFARTQEGHLWQSQSKDDGRTWSEFAPTPLVHPDAPPMIEKLGDGQRLIALHHNRSTGSGPFNHEDRCELWTSLSADGGMTWSGPRLFMVSATESTRKLFGRTFVNLTYSDVLAVDGGLHIFVPHLWRQVLQVRMKESDLERLPLAADLTAQDTKTRKPDPKTGERPKEITLDLGGGVSIISILIPDGEFLMGADKGQPCEKPVHKVVISKPFYMGKYPVTVGQFRAFVDATKHKTQQESWGKEVTWRNPFRPKGTNPPVAFVQGDNYPVVWVSWDDAQAFCKWASKTTGRTVHLPTEAEYEYACRAGTTTRWYSGDTVADLNRIGWHEFDGVPQAIHWETTQPVGLKEPNKFGLYDMNGNVWQWCQDLFSDTYYAESPAIDPQGPTVGHSEHKGSEKDHVFRGATIGHGEGGSASRRSGKYSSFHLGFRVVVECVSPK